MGHYVTAYCSAHGEVDMDDSLAFCPDCYEVTPKGALAEARAENERLKRDVEHYAQAILWEGDMIVTQTRYEQVQARIAELEADVVWAVRGYIRPIDDGQRLAIGIDPQTLFTRMVEWDGTDADILRAVREAREG